ncbi:zinc metalloprotease HtpX [soil metagenome]
MYSEIASNKRKTVFLMLFFVLMVGGLGWLFGLYIGEPAITPYVLIGAGVYALISYYAGSKMALGLNGAQEIQKRDNPRLWRIVENLSITEGMPMPKVYIIDDPAPNAFATGRNPRNAVVGATTGLLDMMDDAELEGVMAHELGHVKNYDIRVTMIAFALVAVISILADILIWMTWFRGSDNRNNNGVFLIVGIVAAILAPLVASMIKLAISRKREYLADASGVLTTRYPDGLARALEKIGQYGSAMRKQNSSTAHLFFANPLKSSKIAGLFSTHPPVEERVKRLRGMTTNV